jgi:hypothetical protein
MAKPCKIDHAVRQPYTPDQCRVCWLYEFDPAHRLIWDKKVEAIDPTCPCIHRGDQVGEAQCKGCKGDVRVKVFACECPAVWQETATIARSVPGSLLCMACQYRVAPLKNSQ